MNTQASSDELGTKIIKALGLPEYTTRLELVFEAGKPILVKCESLALDSCADVDAVAKELAKYELRKIESPNA